MLSVGLTDDAGRLAYLAAFHAALALIAARTGSRPKTHRGVQTEFARLAQHEAGLDVELRAFLPRAYAMKTISDYEIDGLVSVSPADAADAIATAGRFLSVIARLIGHSPGEN